MDADHIFKRLTGSRYLYAHPFAYEERLFEGGPVVGDKVYCLFTTDQNAESNELHLQVDLPTYLNPGFKNKLLADGAKILRDIGFSDEQIAVVDNLPTNDDVVCAVPFENFKNADWYLHHWTTETRIVPASGDCGLKVLLGGEEFILLYQRNGNITDTGCWAVPGGICDGNFSDLAISELNQEAGAIEFTMSADGDNVTLRPVQYVFDGKEAPVAVLNRPDYKKFAAARFKKLYGDDIIVNWAEPIQHDLERLPLSGTQTIMVKDVDGSLLESFQATPDWQETLSIFSYQIYLRVNFDLPVVQDGAAPAPGTKAIFFFDPEFERNCRLFKPGVDMDIEYFRDFTGRFLNRAFGDGTIPPHQFASARPLDSAGKPIIPAPPTPQN